MSFLTSLLSGFLPRVRVALLVAFLGLGVRSYSALAAPSGVTHGEPAADDVIHLGTSTALSGPAADLGVNMVAGIRAALEEANRNGGVRERTFRLTALDDGYEPTRTAPNMRKLVEELGVLAVIGNVGTPTAVAAIPIAMESKTPFIAPFTGAGILRRTPPAREIVNFRASYAEETGSMVDALIQVAGFKPAEIAFFTQRDTYGDAGYTGGVTALKRHGIKDESSIPHVRYERNTVAVERALADLLLIDPSPRAVIMVGAYAPCAAFIKQARENGLEALFLNVSFVGPSSLLKALGPAGEGVIITAVVPHVDSSLPGVRAYREAARRWDPGHVPSFGSLEGYLSARMFIRALEKHDGPVTRRSVIDALEGLGEFDLGIGVTLRLSPDEHQASRMVWPTIIRQGRILSFSWSELAGLNSR